ncbi:hypothetical protein [Xanthomonas sp. NCPPB 2632]|uniref:hypothetical protein n=1 Tax=Xanthomonas sp. NCPPB 2632 TaxID=3240912 RepID=UPI003515602F
MTADYLRPKQTSLYGEVADYTRNDGSIHYIAHLILSGGRVAVIGPVAEGSGKGASNHPDQVFWRSPRCVLTEVLRRASAKPADIVRVEIDCTLMPCEGTNGCTTTVPALMRTAGYDGLSVRVFSHRSEIAPSEGVKPARYYDFTVGARNTVLEAARADTGGWSWAD